MKRNLFCGVEQNLGMVWFFFRNEEVTFEMLRKIMDRRKMKQITEKLWIYTAHSEIIAQIRLRFLSHPF
jgi:hypothetical protein